MKAPTLVDGDVVLWESAAIMAYLCIQAGSDMWPAQAPAEQVEVLRWLSWNDHWQGVVAPFYFEHIVKATFGGGPPDRGSLTAKVPEGVQRLLDISTHDPAAERPNGHGLDVVAASGGEDEAVTLVPVVGVGGDHDVGRGVVRGGVHGIRAVQADRCGEPDVPRLQADESRHWSGPVQARA
jgi:hypothetical protein